MCSRPGAVVTNPTRQVCFYARSMYGEIKDCVGDELLKNVKQV